MPYTPHESLRTLEVGTSYSLASLAPKRHRELPVPELLLNGRGSSLRSHLPQPECPLQSARKQSSVTPSESRIPWRSSRRPAEPSLGAEPQGIVSVVPVKSAFGSGSRTISIFTRSVLHQTPSADLLFTVCRLTQTPPVPGASSEVLRHTHTSIVQLCGSNSSSFLSMLGVVSFLAFFVISLLSHRFST